MSVDEDIIATTKAHYWTRRLSDARLEASLTAYTTALEWLRRYPAHEIEARLVEIIAAKQQNQKERGRVGD